MSIIMVGIGGMDISSDPSDTIKTMALGSCVGIMVYDKVMRVAGLVHIALPESKILEEKARKLPGYFADTAVPALIEKLKKAGIKGTGNLKVKIAGGANVMDPDDIFGIGRRNILSVRKYLWKNRIPIVAEDLGGSISRTTWIEVSTGKVFISTPGVDVKEI